jgi:hypothetical protein
LPHLAALLAVKAHHRDETCILHACSKPVIAVRKPKIEFLQGQSSHSTITCQSCMDAKVCCFLVVLNSYFQSASARYWPISNRDL